MTTRTSPRSERVDHLWRSAGAWFLASLFLAMVSSLIGCSGSKPQGGNASSSSDKASEKKVTPKGEGKRIGISILTSANPFFIEISDAVKGAAAKAGYEVISVSGDNEPNKQQNPFKEFNG